MSLSDPTPQAISSSELRLTIEAGADGPSYASLLPGLSYHPFSYLGCQTLMQHLSVFPPDRMPLKKLQHLPHLFPQVILLQTIVLLASGPGAIQYEQLNTKCQRFPIEFTGILTLLPALSRHLPPRCVLCNPYHLPYPRQCPPFQGPFFLSFKGRMSSGGSARNLPRQWQRPPNLTQRSR